MPLPRKVNPAAVRAELGEAREQATAPEPPFHEATLPDGTVWARFYRRGAGYLVRFPDRADFEISGDGRAVRGWPAPTAEEQTVEHLLQNQVLPLALSRQGRLVFHASAVALDGGAVAFAGPSGRGKSTLAASFARQGGHSVTDDGLEVEPLSEDRGFSVWPGPPTLRLWDDSRAALFGEPDAPLAEPELKVRLGAADAVAFCAEPIPLRRIFFLGEGEGAAADGAITLTPLRAREALIELVRHSFVLDVAARDLAAAHFDQLARLARPPIHHRLDYPRRFDALGEVRQAILDHCAAGAPPRGE